MGKWKNCIVEYRGLLILNGYVCMVLGFECIKWQINAVLMVCLCIKLYSKLKS